jgi:WD40 repeat protein
LKLWDVESGEMILQKIMPPPAAIVWAPDGKRLLVVAPKDQPGAALAGEVQVWEIDGRGEPLRIPLDRRITPYAYTTPLDRVHYVAFRADGALLAVEQGKTVTIWDLTAQTKTLTMENATGPLAWSPDGKLLACLAWAEETRTQPLVQVRDAASGSLVRTSKSAGGAQDLLWSVDGKRLFIGRADNTILVWDPLSGNEYLKLKGPSAYLSWGADGRSLISSGTGHEWQIWKIADLASDER